MGFSKRTWVARQGIGLNKFSIGGASAVELVNMPDEVTVQGDPISAGNLNDLEQRIDDGFALVVEKNDLKNKGSQTEGVYFDGNGVAQPTDLGSAYLKMAIQNNMGFHNSIFRGKNITSYWTDGTLHKRIQGTDGFALFEDLFVGDYFIASINGTNFTCRLAGFDIYWDNGDTVPLQTHHAVIVCDEAFARNVYMNPSNTTAGGYEGSYMHRTVIPIWNAHLANTFGENLITNRELLCNAVSNGIPSIWAWFDCTARLMSEVEVYGAPIWGKTASGTGYNIGTARTQLPLFRLAPQFTNAGRYWWWLTDVVTSVAFAVMYHYGQTAHFLAGDSNGSVRLRFLIK